MQLNGDNHDALCEKLEIDKSYTAVAVLLIGHEDESVDGTSSASVRSDISEKVSFVDGMTWTCILRISSPPITTTCPPPPRNFLWTLSLYYVIMSVLIHMDFMVRLNGSNQVENHDSIF